MQDSTGAFNTEVGLEPGTTYEYRAFGQRDEGEWKAGPSNVFHDSERSALWRFDWAGDERRCRLGHLQGELTGLGDYDSATIYFQYWGRGQKGSTLEWWTGSAQSSSGTFTANVAGLDSETTYVVQAYAQSNESK